MFIYLLTILHVLVCLFLIIVVLLQSGKAADLAGAFGGMGSQTAFGPRGAATVLTKATAIAAAVFMITSLSLSIIATRNRGGQATVLDRATAKQAQKKGAPAAPPVPTVSFGPEGGQMQTQPLPIPPPPGEQKAGETKGGANPKAGATVNVQLPGQAPVEQKKQ